MKKARLTDGTASKLPPDAVSVPHTSTGTRSIDMPGARMRTSVAMKLTEPTVVEMPSRTMPSA